MISLELIEKITNQYQLDLQGRHGIPHWSRVLENGMSIARITGANIEIIELFSVIHDACRINDESDTDHGTRAAELAIQLKNINIIRLPNNDFQSLLSVCRLHTQTKKHEDYNVCVCFDADRLDVGRGGRYPDPSYLCTEVAKRSSFIHQAYINSIENYIPKNILGELCT